MTFQIDYTVHETIPQTFVDDNSTYVGKYVEEMRDVVIAGLMAGVNVSLLSNPGWGKTEIVETILQQIAQADHYNRIDIAPSTSPSKIEGTLDRKRFLEKSEFVNVLDGTPYDKKMRTILLDEVFRASDPTYDVMLHATDPVKQKHCTVVGTANFIAKGDRVAALKDRFALWQWIPDHQIDASKIVNVQMVASSLGVAPKVPGNLPSWADIDAVRKAKPGFRAVKAVDQYISIVAQEAVANGFKVHPRRLAHWRKVVYYNAVYHTQQADFDTIPAQATICMKWAYPCETPEQAILWAQLIGSIQDPVQAAVDAVLANVVPEFRRVAAIADEQTRLQEIAGLGQLMSQSQAGLQQVAQGDPRIDQAVQTLSDWFSQATKGEKPSYTP